MFVENQLKLWKAVKWRLKHPFSSCISDQLFPATGTSGLPCGGWPRGQTTTLQCLYVQGFLQKWDRSSVNLEGKNSVLPINQKGFM